MTGGKSGRLKCTGANGMLPGPGLPRVRTALEEAEEWWQPEDRTFPGVQDDLNRAWVHPVLRPHSHRLSHLLYRGSSRGACTWVRAVSPCTPGQWLEQEWRLRPPEACTGGLNLFVPHVQNQGGSRAFRVGCGQLGLGGRAHQWAAWEVAEPCSLTGSWASPG